MSVIIHGLDMPKSCDECRLFNESWCMALSVENCRKSYNKPPEGGRFPDWCPLVPLPEGHGMLIDADELMNRARGCLDELTILSLEFLVNGSSTIVPAEGGTDECSEN